MVVAGQELPAEDVGIAVYRVPGLKVNTNSFLDVGAASVK
jgi:hypothetical protein